MVKMLMELPKIDAQVTELNKELSDLNTAMEDLVEDIRKFYKTLFGALKKAAEEAYKSEVLDTGMLDSWIGTDKEYASKEDWMEQRIEEWLS